LSVEDDTERARCSDRNDVPEYSLPTSPDETERLRRLRRDKERSAGGDLGGDGGATIDA
jgi:hypothetical protein